MHQPVHRPQLGHEPLRRLEGELVRVSTYTPLNTPGALNDAVGCRRLLPHAVDVMNVAVLPAAEVLRVFMHGDLGPIEHRWLVHVVPVVPVPNMQMASE